MVMGQVKERFDRRKLKLQRIEVVKRGCEPRKRRSSSSKGEGGA